MGKLFGTDGVRGIANTELTPEIAFQLGMAASYYFSRNSFGQGQDKEGHGRPLFFIGRDTRISGEMLEAALAAGICSAGGDVVSIGIAPTPAVAYTARNHKAAAGVVISASHNPFPDNGIKFFDGKGYKLTDEAEDELEKLVFSPQDIAFRPTGTAVGSYKLKRNLVKEYVYYIKTLAKTNFSQLKIVIDCANGAGYYSTPSLFKELGAKILVLNSQPNGFNINENCGSTHLDGLREAVVNNKADLGIANDGDADRCLAVDENGEVVDGDQIMLICALNMMKEKRLVQNTLVATVMSNLGLYKAFEEAKGKVLATQVGDRYVLEAMLKDGYNLGGEQSGHVIFSDYSTTGDGLLTAVMLADSLVKSGKKLSELAKLMTRFPQILVNVKVKSKDGFLDNQAISEAIKAGETQLGQNGRILIRPSGTEPLIRIMAEGPSQDVLNHIANNIADVMKRELA